MNLAYVHYCNLTLNYCSNLDLHDEAGLKEGYTNNDTLPKWGIQASYLGCQEAAKGLIIYLRAQECTTTQKDI